MPSYCTIEVHFMDGRVEEYHGVLHVDEEVLRIWPRHDLYIAIPLANIREYVTY